MSVSEKYMQIKNRGNIIFNSRFLENLSAVQRHEFLNLCHQRTYKANEIVFYQDDPGTGMYFIEEGEVELSTRTPQDDAPHTLTIHPPDCFGMLSTGYELRRFATATCRTDCTLLGFFQPDMKTLKKRHPHIAVALMEVLAKTAMEQLNSAMDELQKPLKERRMANLQYRNHYQSDDK